MNPDTHTHTHTDTHTHTHYFDCLLNSCFFLQGGERYKFPNSNPFVEEDTDKGEVASVAYR